MSEESKNQETNTSSSAGEDNSAWRAIESNPEVMTKLARKIGLPSTWQVADVFGLDADLLAFVPQPAVALQLLFPSAEYKSAKPEVADDAKLKPDELFYLDQVSALPNACGTIALIHGIANNMEMLGVADDSDIAKFVASQKGKTPTEIGTAMAADETLRDAHNSFVEEGQTQAKSNDEKVGHHFVSLIAHDGYVVELDGAYRNSPVRHRKINDGETFLDAAAAVVRDVFIPAGKGNVNFALTVLCAQQND